MTEDILQEIEKGEISTERMTPKLAYSPSYSLYTRDVHEASTISIAFCSHKQSQLAKSVHLLAKCMIQVLPGHLDGSILSGCKFRLAGHLAVG